MSGLIARFQNSLARWAQRILLGNVLVQFLLLSDEIKRLASLQAKRAADSSAALARIEAQQGIHQASTSALRDSEERHFRDLMDAHTRTFERLERIEAAQNRLHDLVEPELKVRRRVVPVVPSWEQVQAEQLTQFEENAK